jgi:hypothetical protein
MFEFHTLNDEGKRHSQWVREEFQRTLDRLTSVLGEGTRETAIMKTKLEEAAFYAQRALALDPRNQAPTAGPGWPEEAPSDPGAA